MEENIKKRLIRNLECLEHLRPKVVTDESSFFESAREALKMKGSNVPLEVLVQLSQYYNLSIDDLLSLDFSQLSRVEHQRIFESLQKVLPTPVDLEVINIYFVSKVRAGYYIQTTDPTGFPELVLPKRLFPGVNLKDYRAFEVEGESMLPGVEPGSILVAEFLENINEVREGCRYVIIHQGGISLKRLFKTDDFSTSGTFRLTSDNPQESDFFIHKAEIKEIWLPKMVMERFSETD